MSRLSFWSTSVTRWTGGRAEDRGHREKRDQGHPSGDHPPVSADGAAVLRKGTEQLGVGDGHRRRFAATTQDQPDDERDGDDRAQRGQDQPRLAQLTAEQRSEERLDAAQVHVRPHLTRVRRRLAPSCGPARTRPGRSPHDLGDRSQRGDPRVAELGEGHRRRADPAASTNCRNATLSSWCARRASSSPASASRTISSIRSM